MCDLTDYNRCPNCGSVLRQVAGFDECPRCDTKIEVIEVPRFLTEAEPGSHVVAHRSGHTYIRLETQEWLCQDTGCVHGDIELYAMEGDSFE